MANQFKAGDTVRRTGSREWRGVREGDIKTVDEVHGGNITPVGHPGITFDGGNFELEETIARATQQIQELKKDI